MTLRKIPLKPLENVYGDKQFDYKYVDAMKPRLARHQELLQIAQTDPIIINWEGYFVYTKDLRELVKMKALVMKRDYISTRRKMSKLHITELGQTLLGETK